MSIWVIKIEMGGKVLDTVDQEKDLGILITKDWKVSLQCMQAYTERQIRFWGNKQDY